MPTTEGSIFLKTKLLAPRVPESSVTRSRLTDILDRGLVRKVVLLSAPPGFGKTTLLSQWVEQCEIPVAWLTLDRADNDVVRFWRYVISGLQTIQKSIGESSLSLLGSPQTPPSNSILATLINDITERIDDIVLILDDLHVITNQAIHDGLEFLIEHMPTNMHLVIATRADPPLPLALLRGRRELIEIRATDLRFTSSETLEFLDQEMGFSFSREDAILLTDRTEGWIAGLQMAMMSMYTKDDPSELIASLTGNHEYILDYLTDEVLEQQPGDLKTFLLQTSILDHLTAPLCEAVTGKEECHAILDKLQKTNVFIIPLDHERRWYRYHSLFSDLLRQRLQREQANKITDLHLRASDWYQHAGMLPEAIEHAFSAEDYERAAKLIEKSAESSLLLGEVKTFLDRVERVPEQTAQEWPLLCVYHAEALLISGKPMDHILPRLQGTAEYNAVQALMASYQGDVELSTKLSRLALDHLPDESNFLKGAITSALGAVLLLSGDVEASIQTFSESAKLGRVGDNLMLVVTALSRLGQLHTLNGKLSDADAFFREAIELCTDQQGDYLPVASMPMIYYAFLLRELNDLDSALDIIHEAIDLSQKSGGFWAVDCHSILALILQSKGDLDAAQKAMGTARKIASSTGGNRFDDLYTAAYQAQLFVVQNRLNDAVRWMRDRGFVNHQKAENIPSSGAPASQPFFIDEIERTTAARIHLALGQPKKAMTLLEPMLVQCEKMGRTRSVIENLSLQAIALQAQGKIDQAVETFQPVLSSAEQFGYYRILIDEGEPMFQLLTNVVKSGKTTTYISKLLEGFKAEDRALTPQDSSNTLSEPLSEREMQVLRLLSTDLSVSDIAAELFIAASTARTHVKAIYRKLDVHSRYEAVMRANYFDLL
jgi:LuxR family maltose regulon positive regulatory protein